MDYLKQIAADKAKKQDEVKSENIELVEDVKYLQTKYDILYEQFYRLKSEHEALVGLLKKTTLKLKEVLYILETLI